MSLTITKNMNKEMDFVNGMDCTVVKVYRSGIYVKTDTGFDVIVYRWTDEWKNTFYPVRPAYANTLLKMQGATIKHLTIFLDVPGIEAAGYVALSRVRKDAHWQYVGDPGVHHFIPATGF